MKGSLIKVVIAVVVILLIVNAKVQAVENIHLGIMNLMPINCSKKPIIKRNTIQENKNRLRTLHILPRIRRLLR